jgi:amino acid transporter
MQETTEPAQAGGNQLRRNTLGLRHAIVISVAVMSPAASIFFNTIPQASQVGSAITLCCIIGFVVSLLVANAYSEFSREIPSSGSSYTFVTEGLGPRAGFMSAWMGLMALLVGVPYSFILLSANIQALLMRWFSLDLHWSIVFVVLVGVAFAICYLGVRQSMNVDLTFLAFEIGVCLLLGVLVLVFASGHGQLSAQPFTLQGVPANGSLIVGVVLGVLNYVGFETAAALGEETKHPHRNIPRAVFGSMVVVGLFYVIMAYVGTIGYGPDKMVTGFANDPAPFDTISRHYGGPWLAVLVDLAGVFSFFGAGVAVINGGSRIMYTVGREGLLPPAFAYLSRARHTPLGAIVVMCAFALVIGLILGFVMTPITAFGFLGTLDALFVLIVYALVSASSIVFFRRKRRAQFRWFLHGLVPALGTLLIATIFLLVFISPELPPLNLVPYILLTWLLIGIILLIVLRGKLTSAAPELPTPVSIDYEH